MGDEKFRIIASEYESQGLTTQYIENLQEAKRKTKVENEVNKTKSATLTLTQEIISGNEALTEQQNLYDKNKGVITQLDELQSNIQYLEGEISKMKETLAAALSELSGIRSSLEELEEDITKKEKHRRKEKSSNRHRTGLSNVLSLLPKILKICVRKHQGRIQPAISEMVQYSPRIGGYRRRSG